jgi:hypothetical protein
LVDVYDETGETVALATILTMVKKLKDEWEIENVKLRIENFEKTIFLQFYNFSLAQFLSESPF